MSRFISFAAIGLVTAVSYSAETQSDPVIEELLKPIRDKHKLPALWGGIVVGDELAAAGVVGVRKTGDETPATIADQIHIGSCTKAMTATMLATLVEEKKLGWESTIGEVFPDDKEKVHKDFHDATLWRLLTHTSGAQANGQWWSLGADKSTTEQRRVLLQTLFSEPPDSPPGTEFSYSNAGYAVAGLMGETVAGTSWEDLMRRRLFEPLGMTSAGFGPPGTKKQVDQPWGHAKLGGLLIAQQADNAPSIGPAGTVHCSLADWSKFISLHLAGEGDSPRLLSKDSFTRLHTPPEGRDYAAGWIILQRPWADGRAIFHNGSNTKWFAVVWMSPKRNFAVMAVTNCGGDGAAKACDEVASALIGHHLKR